MIWSYGKQNQKCWELTVHFEKVQKFHFRQFSKHLLESTFGPKNNIPYASIKSQRNVSQMLRTYSILLTKKFTTWLNNSKCSKMLGTYTICSDRKVQIKEQYLQICIKCLELTVFLTKKFTTWLSISKCFKMLGTYTICSDQRFKSRNIINSIFNQKPLRKCKFLEKSGKIDVQIVFHLRLLRELYDAF